MYYIKKITMTGKGVETSSVELQPGVNILYGSSNTGKSYVAETRIDDNKGYDRIHIEFDVDGAYLSMERMLNTTKIKVVSTVQDIESGEYTLEGNNRICHVWLKLIGIDAKHRINKSAHCQREELSNRAFDQIFVLREKKIDAEGSILLPSEHSREPVAKAALLFLMTGEDHDDGKDYDKPDIHKAKKEAVVAFADEQLKTIQDQENELKLDPDAETPVQIEKRMTTILAEIDHTESEIKSLIEENKEIGATIYQIDKELTECRVLEDRYRSLQSQYRSDLKRLTFMAEGEHITKDGVVQPQACPFCGNAMGKEKEESCMEAASVEVARITPKIVDLKSVQKSLKTEIADKEAQREKLQARMKELEDKVSQELQPKVDLLREELSRFSLALTLHSKKTAYEDVSERIRGNLIAFKSKPEPPNFKINEYYGEEFMTRFHAILDKLLTECKFDDYRTSEFDLKAFDIKVNQTKKKSYGQGFRAFLNVILSMAVQEYLAQYGEYRPKIFVMDSPVLSLKEDVDDSELASESMKSSLFKYIINHPCAEQIIIIENELPPVDYSTVRMEKYTKGHGFWKTNP